MNYNLLYSEKYGYLHHAKANDIPGKDEICIDENLTSEQLHQFNLYLYDNGIDEDDLNLTVGEFKEHWKTFLWLFTN